MLEAYRANRTETVGTQVYRLLRGALISGHFRPGQPISIRYLTDQLGVSGTPAREALKRLEAEQALVKGPNRVLTVPLLDRAALRDLRDIRAALEGLAAERSVDHLTEREIDAVARRCEEMDAAVASQDTDRYLNANWAFHRTVYEGAQSELLIKMIEGLWMRIGPFFRLVLPSQEHMAKSMRCHRDVLDALRRRDKVAARAAIAADIVGAADDLEPLLSGGLVRANRLGPARGIVGPGPTGFKKAPRRGARAAG